MRYILVAILLFFCGQICFSQDSLQELNELKAMKTVLTQRANDLKKIRIERQRLLDSCKNKVAQVDAELSASKQGPDKKQHEKQLAQLKAQIKEIEERKSNDEQTLTEFDLLMKELDDKINKLSKKGE